MNNQDALLSITSAKSRPRLRRLLKSLRLDMQFTHAQGNHLFFKDEHGETRTVLDFVGGYGSSLLGHHHPELNALAIELLQQNIPIQAQLSEKKSVQDLATFISDELKESTGFEYVTTFANSGAEAVEAAIKHARLEYAHRKKKLEDRFHQTLHTIDNYFEREQTPFSLEWESRSFSTLDEFKLLCVDRFQTAFSKQHPVMLAQEKSFHGKTTGALEVTSNPLYKYGFVDPSLQRNVVFFEPTEADFSERINALATSIPIPRFNNGTIDFDEIPFLFCLGVIVEPIQGEGGVRIMDKDFAAFLRNKTHQQKIPLIFDEIQCGSYRTGTIMYASQLGIAADYYLLSKSLGGGMVKNSALIIDQRRYIDGFGVVHTSTFADDEFTATISLKALELSKQAQSTILQKGESLGIALHHLHEQHPTVIREVRGTGLMWGIEFHDLHLSENYSFQMFSRSGFLNYLFCSYLLNVWSLRMAPTLSDPFTLRVLPSLFIEERDIAQLSLAIQTLCEIVHRRDFYKLIEHLLPEEQQELRELTDFGRGNVTVDTDETLNNVGFITHYINEDGVRDGDPSLSVVSNECINHLLESVIEISSPILLHARTIEGISGEKINAYFGGMLFTAAMARTMMDKNLFDEYAQLCNDAVDFLHADFHCALVGLGQYSSVITKNGKSITNPSVKVTTGNSYTVGIGVQAILGEIRPQLDANEELTLGVLGAAGNICSTYTKCFLPYFSRMIFKGSNSDSGKINTIRFIRELIVHVFGMMSEDPNARGSKVHAKLYDALSATNVFKNIQNSSIPLNGATIYENLCAELGDNMPFVIIDDLMDLRACNVTVVATNSPEPFLYSRYFRPGSIVYDISVPLNCTEELINNQEGINVIMGGVVQLPYNQSIVMRAYPLGEGEAFACISETILLGLEQRISNFSFGNLHPTQVEFMNELARKHGFSLKKNKKETIF